MDKKELLDNLRTLTEAVEKSCNDGAQDAGDIVRGILNDTDISCTYETVRKIVSAITHCSDITRMSLAKCLKEDGWTCSCAGPESPDVSAFVGEVLGSTDKYTVREAVGEFVSQIEKHGGKQALENCLHDLGWVKVGEDVNCKTVASAIAHMELDSQKECAIGSLIDALTDESASTSNALACALEKQGYVQKDDYVEKGSCEFEDLAIEWAEDNGYLHPEHDSITDFADAAPGSDIRDFVVEYIESHL